MRFKKYSVLPGFGLTMGITLVYLGLLVLIPLAGLFIRSASASWTEVWGKISDPRVLASYRLSFGASIVAATINGVFGFVVAWSLVRYRFPGRRLIDAMVDLPFALPTAVSGIALATIMGSNGWVGSRLEPLGVKVAFTRIGVVVALVLVGLPFVVRTLQPALEDLETELEEAAAMLGAGRFTTFWRVLFPAVLPALATGFALSFARAVGEYGSVVFIAGNLPMKTEIAPLLIVIKLEQYDYLGATAIGAAMLVLSFALLLVINLLQAWGRDRMAGAHS
ncbi:MAG TPA: sulfate ABC transporter permease subunit CysT [Thermoanaerobaculia bacterium]|nr:sulfate ABC transporter permease subunit CysT [Thermoanaerobaculia bacterium]